MIVKCNYLLSWISFVHVYIIQKQNKTTQQCSRCRSFCDEGYLYKRVVHGSNAGCGCIVYKKVCVDTVKLNLISKFTVQLYSLYYFCSAGTNLFYIIYHYPLSYCYLLFFPIILFMYFSFIETAPKLEDDDDEYLFIGDGDDIVER